MPPSGDRKVSSPVGNCPLRNCAITVLVRLHKGPNRGVAGVKVEVRRSDGAVFDRKQTDGEGVASFKGIKQVNETYTVKVSLDPRDKANFAWFTAEA